MAADSDAEEVVQVTASATRPGARTHQPQRAQQRAGASALLRPPLPLVPEEEGSRDEEDQAVEEEEPAMVPAPAKKMVLKDSKWTS